MVKYLLTLTIIIGFVCCRSNTKNSNLEIETRLPVSSNSIFIRDSADIRKEQDTLTTKVYTFAEQMPQYPGGETEMMKFISENLKVPQEFVESGLQGRVVLRFIVTETGQIENIRVMKTPDSLFSQAHVDVIKAMPRWEPGKQDGEAVSVYYTLPLSLHFK